MRHEIAPVVIVGAGLAGLATALAVADRRPVVVLAKRPLGEAATAWAQGGIVGVVGDDDSIDAHVADTCNAGAGLVDEAAARFVSANSAAALEWLVAQGVPFTSDPAGPLGLHLTREGGHGVRRIAHAADATGKAIHDSLLARARAHPGIVLRERVMAVDLIVRAEAGARNEADSSARAGTVTAAVAAAEAEAAAETAAETAAAARADTGAIGLQRCIGLHALDIETGRVQTLAASAVVLATGGVGKVYRYTTNPDTATGDGIAMAWRAGCRVANMEFIQFHPTCLYHPQERSFLITEALRGEGAVLRLPAGEPGQDRRPGDDSPFGPRFMPDHDPRAELAPRDVVARAIDFEMKKHGFDHVWLDATRLGADFLKAHFPTIHARCLALGIDIARQPIPVVPAAHYTCGGIVTDLQGRTDLPGLHAVGETACTGLHGANRLASNSLLECIVLGQSCARSLLEAPVIASSAPAPWDESQVEDPDEQIVIAHNWDELRLLMWNYVGIVRTTRRLERALNRIALLREEIDDFYGNFRVNRDLLELRNLVDCAELVVRSGLLRRESRGLHYSRDFPMKLPVAFSTVLGSPACSGCLTRPRRHGP